MMATKSVSPIFLHVVVSLLTTLLFAPSVFALITGGEGNQPIRDPGWPDGAAEIFNHEARVAYWEGPPFGGGQYHAECRGDAEAFNEVLAKFAKLEVKNKRLIVNDGIGRSFWLNPNRDAAKKKNAQIDWQLMVWVAANWERLSNMPPDLNPTDRKNNDSPPAEITLYTGGNISWDDVVVPDGIEVVDNRMEAHGYTASDGAVLEGTIADLATGDTIAGHVVLQEIKPKETGGYDYNTIKEVTANKEGKWVIKKTPAGWFQIVAAAEGFVPRIVGHIKVDEQPSWQAYHGQLAKPATVSGQVTTADETPLAGVNVRLSNLSAGDNARYKTPHDLKATTDADGKFEIANAPEGTATIHVHKEGYVRPGLGPGIEVPTSNVQLQMTQSAELKVVVMFQTTELPNAYIVNIEPEGGSKVGSWGGSANIDDQNQVVFKHIPPGKYTLVGHPNPHSAEEKSVPITIELTGGAQELVTLKAKQ